MKPENLEAMRQQFLADVATAAPRTRETTFAGWDADVQAFLATLRPWLKDEDLMLSPRPEFCRVEGLSIPFSIDGYAYFRGWLRKRHLDPDDFVPEESPGTGPQRLGLRDPALHEEASSTAARSD